MTGRAPFLSRFVTDADPFEAGSPVIAVQPLDEADDRVAAELTARVLNEWMMRSKARLEDGAGTGRHLPGNFATVKWAGFAPRAAAVREAVGAQGRHGRERAALRRHRQGGRVWTTSIPGFLGGRPREDLEQRLQLAEELFVQGYEFVHVHSKVPDSAGHRKDPSTRHSASRSSTRRSPTSSVSRLWDARRTRRRRHRRPRHAFVRPAVPLGRGRPAARRRGASPAATRSARFGETREPQGLLGQLRGIDLMPVLLMAADRSAFLAERFTADLRSAVSTATIWCRSRASGRDAKEA